MIFKSVDDKLRELNFYLVMQNDLGAEYRRIDPELTMVHRVDLQYMDDGTVALYSYELNVSEDKKTVGLDKTELKLFVKKMKEMERDYLRLTANSSQKNQSLL